MPGNTLSIRYPLGELISLLNEIVTLFEFTGEDIGFLSVPVFVYPLSTFSP